MNPEDIRRVGRWPVRRILGQGGFSWVFEVVDERLGVARALKMLRPEAARGEQFKRFWREARLLASFSDPNLVTIYDLDQDPETGCHYYVMELFSGCNFEAALAAEPGGYFEWTRSVDLFLGILQALGRLHAHRPDPIVHRDIKPSNIQLTAEGRPKLFDLGIARVLRQSDATVGDSTALTSAHSFIGTPKYASPEQLEGRELGTESDVFSLGLCLYQSLAGRHLYESLSDLDTQSYQSIHRYMVIAEHRRTELPIAFAKQLGVPAAVQAVVEKSLRLRPEDRFHDAVEMRQALVAAREGKQVAAVRPARRLRWVAAAAILALLGGGLWLARPRIMEWVRASVNPPIVDARLAAEVQGLQEAARSAQQRAEAGGAVDVKAFSEAMEAAARALGAGDAAKASRNLTEAQRQYAAAGDEYGRAALIRTAVLERKSASDMSAELEKQVSAGNVEAATAQPFRDALGRAELAWAAGSYEDAEQGYRTALSSGREILASIAGGAPPLPTPPADLLEKFADLDAARSKARGAGAERAAESAFQHADDLAQQARAASDGRRYGDAGKLIAEANDAYGVAAAAAGTALAEARSAMHKAEARAADLGDCSKLASHSKAACRQGEDALAAGRQALGRSDAGEALRSFQDAGHEFELAASPMAPANEPPSLRLDVKSRLSLAVGDRRTIHATAKDPNGEPVTITFTLTDPQGRKKAHAGTSFSFAAERSGEYHLEAVARDAEGAESRPERVALRVKPTAPRSPPAAADAVGQTLSEYAAAIKAKDLLALGSVYRMPPGVRTFFETLFDKYAGLDVTTYVLSQDVHGDTGSVRFTQTLRGINPDGSFTPIAQGPMKAELIHRPGGWQITELKAAD